MKINFFLLLGAVSLLAGCSLKDTTNLISNQWNQLLGNSGAYTIQVLDNGYYPLSEDPNYLSIFNQLNYNTGSVSGELSILEQNSGTLLKLLSINPSIFKINHKEITSNGYIFLVLPYSRKPLSQLQYYSSAVTLKDNEYFVTCGDVSDISNTCIMLIVSGNNTTISFDKEYHYGNISNKYTEPVDKISSNVQDMSGNENQIGEDKKTENANSDNVVPINYEKDEFIISSKEKNYILTFKKTNKKTDQGYFYYQVYYNGNVVLDQVPYMYMGNGDVEFASYKFDPISNIFEYSLEGLAGSYYKYDIINKLYKIVYLWGLNDVDLTINDNLKIKVTGTKPPITEIYSKTDNTFNLLKKFSLYILSSGDKNKIKDVNKWPGAVGIGDYFDFGSELSGNSLIISDILKKVIIPFDDPTNPIVIDNTQAFEEVKKNVYSNQ